MIEKEFRGDPGSSVLLNTAIKREKKKFIRCDKAKSCAEVKYCFNVAAYWSKAISVNCCPQSYWMKLKSMAFKQFIA